MVVEDERVVARDLAATLAYLGYEVVGLAGSGEDAVAKASEVRPDLILTDIRLAARIDGIEVATIIKKERDTPVIYLTAHSDNDTLRRATTTEPLAYLVKPFNPVELKCSIEVSLYRHEIEARLREREQWLATTLRSIADGVVATGPTQRSSSSTLPPKRPPAGNTKRRSARQSRRSSRSSSRRAPMPTGARPIAPLERIRRRCHDGPGPSSTALGPRSRATTPRRQFSTTKVPFSAESRCFATSPSVRRECLDHLIILSEPQLQQVLAEYALSYFNTARPHQGIGQRVPLPGDRGQARVGGKVTAIPVLRGLHHDYRAAA